MVGYHPIRNSGDVSPNGVNASYDAPAKDLRLFIECYWEYSTNVPEVPIQVFPSGCCSLGFSLQADRLKGYLYGPFQSNDAVGLFVENTIYFGAAFKVNPNLEFSNASVHELAKHRVDIVDLWPTIFQDIETETLSASVDARKGFLTKVLRTILRHRDRPMRECEHVIESFIASPSQRIHKLARQSGFSEKRLQRFFNAHIGMSPKRFETVVRFQCALNKVVNTQEPFASVAADMGYSDQAHLVRTFGLMLGDTPHRTRKGAGYGFQHQQELGLIGWHEY